MSTARRTLALLLALASLTLPVLAAEENDTEPAEGTEISEAQAEEISASPDAESVEASGTPACDHPGWQNGVCVACGTQCPHTEHDYDSCVCFTCGQTVGHSYLTSECPMCGRTPVFTDTTVPQWLFEAPAAGGSVETVTYATHDYVDERLGYGYGEYYKDMRVYLPAGYDAAKQYDVLILLHGTGSNETYWFGSQLYGAYGTDYYVSSVSMIDNMIAAGMAKEMIIVTPTFYRSRDYSRYSREKDEEQFARELRSDILPCIIERYSTYAADGSTEAITAARDHFAYAGLSMGSIYAYNTILPLCLDLFAWYGCFSGSDCYVDLAVSALNSENNAPYPIRYFYNSVGTNDSMAALHREQFIAVTDRTDKLTDGENAWFTQVRSVGHEYSAWIAGLYNFLQVAFMM
jgi:hypothetical protein